MDADTKIRIILADDHELIRESFKMLLGNEADVEVVGEAGSGRTAVQLTRQLTPDVVVMDVRMPVIDGIEASRLIIRENPDVKILVVSANLHKDIIEEAVSAGVSGLMLKDCAYDELAGAIRSVYKDEKYLSPMIYELLRSEQCCLAEDLAKFIRAYPLSKLGLESAL